MSAANAIVTLAVGAYHKRLWQTRCLPNWSRYAERHGYDLICIDQPLDVSERARKAVSGRVKDSISRIRKQHPVLGLHLTNSLRLGTFCCYQPAEQVRWDLDSGS